MLAAAGCLRTLAFNIYLQQMYGRHRHEPEMRISHRPHCVSDAKFIFRDLPVAEYMGTNTTRFSSLVTTASDQSLYNLYWKDNGRPRCAMPQATPKC